MAPLLELIFLAFSGEKGVHHHDHRLSHRRVMALSGDGRPSRLRMNGHGLPTSYAALNPSASFQSPWPSFLHFLLGDLI